MRDEDEARLSLSSLSLSNDDVKDYAGLPGPSYDDIIRAFIFPEKVSLEEHLFHRCSIFLD